MTAKRAILFLVIFFLLDRSAGFFLRRSYDAGLDPFFRRYDAMVSARAGADVMVTGDSQAHHGIDPVLTGKFCSCRVANLSLDGTNMIVTWFLVRGYLEYNAPPKIAVLQTSILQNAKYDRDGEHYLLLYERLPFRDIAEYLWSGRDLKFATKELIETYRYRSALARALRLERIAPPAYQSVNGYDPLLGHREGFDEIYPTHGTTGESETIVADPVQERYLKKTLFLLRQKGIRVIMTQPPMVTRFREISNVAEFNTMMESVAREYGAAYYDFNRPEYADLQDRTYFYDGSHMNTEGAFAYAKHLGNLFRGYMK